MKKGAGSKTRILIFAKTYPERSKKYDETVCTGGILEDGTLIRLFPVAFRHLDKEQQFKRYQWIEAHIEKSPEDPRKESYRIDQDSIEIVSEPLSTDRGWAARRAIVLRQESKSIEELRDRHEADGTSLGIFKPKEVLRLFERPWPEEQHRKARELAARSDLFRAELQPLEALPYKFVFEFRCDDSRCSGHQCLVSDWEVYALYRHSRESSQTDEEARQKVIDRIFGKYCSDDYDMHFYVGTHRVYGSWMIVGLFYPSKYEPLPNLFEE